MSEERCPHIHQSVYGPGNWRCSDCQQWVETILMGKEGDGYKREYGEVVRDKYGKILCYFAPAIRYKDIKNGPMGIESEEDDD